ncbi:MAG: hypothetical protein IKA82_00735 [Clostridia bacterium]|nr:hypothetical protein [Clostridia bacterium]
MLRYTRRETYDRIKFICLVVSIILFLGFFVYSMIIGGEAVTRPHRINEDKYYVTLGGKETEVTKTQYTVNRTWGFTSLGMIMISFIMYLRPRRAIDQFIDAVDDNLHNLR